MKKNYFFLTLPLIPIIIILMANSSGSPGGKSGSPGDGSHNCTDCHTGSPNPVSGWITTNVPSEGYTPGDTYTITATGTHTGVGKFGFELTVEDQSGNKVGTLIVTDATQTKFTNGNNAITHTSGGNTPSGNSKTWTMDWTAPTGVSGNIGIYAAFNAADGTGNTSGDVIYTSNTFISEAVADPEIVGITPDDATQGDMITATVTGQNTTWDGTTPAVSLVLHDNPADVITGTGVNVSDNTHLDIDFDFAEDATIGMYDLHVDDLELENGFEVLLTTGIDNPLMSTISIFPNPSEGLFNIISPENAIIEIFGLTGNMVYRNENSNKTNVIDLSGNPEGLYILRIVKDGSESVEKIVLR